MSKSGIFGRAKRSLRSRLGLSAPLSRVNIGGREFIVRDGTVRVEPDYDDAWLLALSRRSPVVFDVGPNVGQSTLIIALGGARQIVLIEANPSALCVAAEHLIRNHLSAQARFVTAFASDTSDETVQFWTVGTGAAGSDRPEFARTASRAGESFAVPTTTLDAVSAVYDLTPDLVKVDVEGAEGKVLGGSREIARRGRTRFLVEMHSGAGMTMAQNVESALNWCREVDYRAWYLARGEALAGAGPVASRGRCHLLLQPKDWDYPAWLRSLKQGAALEEALRED